MSNGKSMVINTVFTIKHLLNCITLVSFTTVYMMHGTMKTKNYTKYFV